MKNKPILFIDEKPYLDDAEYRNKAEKQLVELKDSLQSYGCLDLVEFYFEDSKNTVENFKKSENSYFRELLAGRKIVIAHTSYPDSFDPDPVMAETTIESFKRNIKDTNTPLILFSGSMHLRKRYENTVQINRSVLYANLDYFIYEWSENKDSKPYFNILFDGKSAYYNDALKHFNEIQKLLSERKQGLASKVGTEIAQEFKIQNWRKYIANDQFVKICELANWNSTKIQLAANKLKSKEYENRADYLKDVKKVVELTKPY